MTDLFYETQGGDIRQVPKTRKGNGKHYLPGVNPLISAYGAMEGKKCGECNHHYFKRMSKSYPKCRLRRNTCSARTDHSSRLPACGKFIPKIES